MAIHVTAYDAPLVGGRAYVAPDATLANLRGAGSLLADGPKGVQLVVCSSDPLGGADAFAPEAGKSDGFESEARLLFRRAAVAATATFDQPRLPAAGRFSRGVRRTLGGFGWLLLLTGGTIGAGLCGLWLALGFPIVRRRIIDGSDSTHEAAALGHAIGSAPIVRRAHAGLTSLAQLLGDGDHRGRAPNERYRLAAAACPALGLAPLVDFYAALGRGVAPSMPWAEAQPPKETRDEPLHEPA